MKIIFILLLLHYVAAAANYNECVIKYLQRYGYAEKSEVEKSEEGSNTWISQALEHFQEAYNLTIDGTASEETLRVMNTPRCGVVDNLNNFNTAEERWNKTHIKWHFYFGNAELIKLTKEAFQMWEDQSGLTFEHDKNNPDIIISYQRLAHFIKKTNQRCPYDLDGRGNVLAHAFFPSYNRVTEIHIDQDEPWSANKTGEERKYNLFQVLVHEIGHTLGLHHTFNEKSVMYALYSNKWDGHLGQIDILNIQNLYGMRKPTTTIASSTPAVRKNPKTPVTSSTPVDKSPDTSLEKNVPILCDVKNLNTFLIIDRKMYAFYSKWVWPIAINIDNNRVFRPIILSNLLKYLPQNVNKISAIYQRPNGNIVFFANNQVYAMTYPNMYLLPGYPKPINSVFRSLSKVSVINGIVNTYMGKTYIFYDNQHYTEINECDFTMVKQGFISDIFPGIPHGIQSVFRYINGHLYFFKRDQFYEFNEFTRTVERTGTFSLSIFNISCPKPNLLEQLYQLLLQLRTKYAGYIETIRQGEEDEEMGEIYEDR